MAGKALFPSEGGLPGISAGVPFTLTHYVFVSQVTPPFVASGRLAQASDAPQSITAVGVNASPHSFIVGENAVDAVGGDRAVLVGFNLRQNSAGAGQAVDQVLVGNTIQLPLAAVNSQGLVAIGSAFTFTTFPAALSLGNSVGIGPNVTFLALNAAGGDADNLVVVGASAQGTGGSVVIGNAAKGLDLTAVVIGQNALGGLQSVALGLTADATAPRSISIGDRARAGSADTIALGWFADCANSDSAIAIGRQANSAAKFANIMLGRNASVAIDNFMQIGGDATYFINEIRFGAGFTQSTGAQTYTFGITTVFGGAGNNLAGNGLVIRSGLGTGNWANAQGLGIDLQCGLVQAAGSTQQPYTSVLALRHSDLNVALWGGMGAAFNGGVKVLFIGNATTPPAGATVGGAIIFASGNVLKGLGSTGAVTTLAP